MRIKIGNLKTYFNQLFHLKTEKKDFFINFLNLNSSYNNGGVYLRDLFQSIEYFTYDQVETRNINGVSVALFDYTFKITPSISGQAVHINAYLPSTQLTDDEGIIQGQFGIADNTPINIIVDELITNKGKKYSGLNELVELNLD